MKHNIPLYTSGILLFKLWNNLSNWFSIIKHIFYEFIIVKNKGFISLLKTIEYIFPQSPFLPSIILKPEPNISEYNFTFNILLFCVPNSVLFHKRIF